MADDDREDADLKADWKTRMESDKFGIGQRSDGTLDIFPPSELRERLAKQRSEEEAAQYAIDQMEKGFPGEDVEDFSDLTGE